MKNEEVLDFCKELISKKLAVPKEHILDESRFIDLRLNSLHVMQLILELEDRFKVEVNPVLFWEYPTLSSFCTKVSTLS